MFVNILYAILNFFFLPSDCNIGKPIFNLLSDIRMKAELNACKVTFIKMILILHNRVPESQLLTRGLIEQLSSPHAHVSIKQGFSQQR